MTFDPQRDRRGFPRFSTTDHESQMVDLMRIFMLFALFIINHHYLALADLRFSRRFPRITNRRPP